MPSVVDLASSRAFCFSSNTIEDLLDDISQSDIIGGPRELLRLREKSLDIQHNNLTDDDVFVCYYELNGGAPLDVTSVYTLFAGLFLIAVGVCWFIFLGILALILFYVLKCTSTVCGIPKPNRKMEVEEKAV